MLRSFGGVLGNAEPVCHHQQEWPCAADLVMPYERAFARHAAGLIIDALDRHINLPGLGEVCAMLYITANKDIEKGEEQ